MAQSQAQIAGGEITVETAADDHGKGTTIQVAVVAVGTQARQGIPGLIAGVSQGPLQLDQALVLTEAEIVGRPAGFHQIEAAGAEGSAQAHRFPQRKCVAQRPQG